MWTWSLQKNSRLMLNKRPHKCRIYIAGSLLRSHRWCSIELRDGKATSHQYQGSYDGISTQIIHRKKISPSHRKFSPVAKFQPAAPIFFWPRRAPRLFIFIVLVDTSTKSLIHQIYKNAILGSRSTRRTKNIVRA